MIEGKIKNTSQLKKIVSSLKSKGKKIVFTNGCFDILHYGHVKYLQEAKTKGDILIVGVNSDSSVKKIKGRPRPVIAQKQRAYLVGALECVDYAVIFSQTTPIALIRAIRPHVLVKGGNWKKKEIVGSEFVKSYGAKTLTIPYISGLSTSGIIKRIAGKFNL